MPTSQLTSGIADEVLVVLKTRYGMSYMSLEDPLIDFLLGSLAASHATRKTLSSTVIASVHTRLAQFVCEYGLSIFTIEEASANDKSCWAFCFSM